MADKIKVNLKIDPEGKSYGLTINKEDEELVRRAAKLLSEKFIQYRQYYRSDDTSNYDILSMLLIDESITKLKLKKQNDTEPFTSKIRQWDKELQEYLKV